MRRFFAGLLLALLTLGLVAPLLALQAPILTPVGTFLQALAPIFTTLAVSGLTYVANTGLGIIKGWSNPAKYVAMGVIGIVVSTVFGLLGHTVSSDTASWTNATAQGLAAAGVAAIIWKIGRGAPPKEPA